MTDKRLKKARANGDNFVRVSLAGTNLRVTAHGEEEQEVRPLLETFLRGYVVIRRGMKNLCLSSFILGATTA